MPTNLFFTTPIYDAHEHSDELNAELDAVVKNIKAENNLSNPWQDGVKTTFNYEKSNDIEKYDLKKLQEVVFKHASIYCEELGLSPNYGLKIKDCWFNFYEHNDYQHFHSHPNVDICFVYYHKAEQNSGSIMFVSSDMGHEMSRLFANCKNLCVQHRIGLPPETGRVVIFPAHLRHAVMKNETQTERISVAVNLTIEVNS